MQRPRAITVTAILAANALLLAASAHERVVDATLSRAQSRDGRCISWREHIVDDKAVGGAPISGSDGLAMADLDLDGFLDIVSVHESDTQYDGVADGLIRIAFGSADPNRWELVTLASGSEAGAAEDVAIGDVNGDGYPDLIAACELAIAPNKGAQNPGRETKSRNAITVSRRSGPCASSSGVGLRLGTRRAIGSGPLR